MWIEEATESVKASKPCTSYGRAFYILLLRDEHLEEDEGS